MNSHLVSAVVSLDLFVIAAERMRGTLKEVRGEPNLNGSGGARKSSPARQSLRSGMMKESAQGGRNSMYAVPKVGKDLIHLNNRMNE